MKYSNVKYFLIIISCSIFSLAAMQAPESDQQQLYQAVLKGDYGLINKLLDKGVNPNIFDPITREHIVIKLINQMKVSTLIDFYTHQKQKNMVIKKIIQSPYFDVNSTDHKGKTILMHIINLFSDEYLMPILENSKLNINEQDTVGRTALHYAVIGNNPQKITVILKKPNLNINAKDNTGKTALHYAIIHNNSHNAVKMSRVLMNHPQIEINISDTKGKTPLDYAKTEALRKLLINKGAISGTSEQQKRPREETKEFEQPAPKRPYVSPAAQRFGFTPQPQAPSGMPRFYQQPQSATYSFGQFGVPSFKPSPQMAAFIPSKNVEEELFEAIKTDDFLSIPHLLTQIKNPNVKDLLGKTPLMYAVNVSPDIVKQLLELPTINPNIQDPEGNTALMIAADAGKLESVKELLKSNKVNIHIRNNKNLNALQLASTRYGSPFDETAQLLFEKRTQAVTPVSTKPLFASEVYEQLALSSAPTPHQILGLSATASPDDIKKAYRNLSLKWHPDKNPHNPLASDVFKLIQWAYSVLAKQQ